MPWKTWTEERKKRARVSNRKWVAANREQALADKRERESEYRKDPEKLARKQEKGRAAWRKYRSTDKWIATARKAHLQHKYGITPEQYDRMFQDQNGVCAICKQPETASRAGKIKLLSVDHSHITKQIRGLLCDNCNKSLGTMHENIERLQSAIEYLNQYSKGQEQ